MLPLQLSFLYMEHIKKISSSVSSTKLAAAVDEIKMVSRRCYQHCKLLAIRSYPCILNFFFTDNLNSKCRREHNMSTGLRSLPALWPNDKAICFLTLMMISIRLDDLSFYQMNTFKVAYRKSFTILIQWPYFFDLANKKCKNQVCNILTSLFKGPLFDCFFFFFY